MSEVLNEPHEDGNINWFHEPNCAYQINNTKDCTCGDTAAEQYRKEFEEWYHSLD